MAPKSPSQQQQQQAPQQQQVSFKDVQTSPPDLPPVVVASSPPDFRRHFPIMAPLMEDRSSPSTPKGGVSSGNTSGNSSGGENSAPTTTRTTPYDTQQSSPAAAFLKSAPTATSSTGVPGADTEPEYAIADYALEDGIVEASKDVEEGEDDEQEEEEEEEDEDDDVVDYVVSEKEAEATPVGVVPATTATGAAANNIDSAATPSDAAYVATAAGTPVPDADYAAATPADVATLHILLEDSTKSKHENQLVGRFISKGCSCTLGPKGQPCYTGFSIEDILKKRNAALALPKNERELIVKAYLLHMRREPEHNPG